MGGGVAAAALVLGPAGPARGARRSGSPARPCQVSPLRLPCFAFPGLSVSLGDAGLASGLGRELALLQRVDSPCPACDLGQWWLQPARSGAGVWRFSEAGGVLGPGACRESLHIEPLRPPRFVGLEAVPCGRSARARRAGREWWASASHLPSLLSPSVPIYGAARRVCVVCVDDVRCPQGLGSPECLPREGTFPLIHFGIKILQLHFLACI